MGQKVTLKSIVWRQQKGCHYCSIWENERSFPPERDGGRREERSQGEEIEWDAPGRWGKVGNTWGKGPVKTSYGCVVKDQRHLVFSRKWLTLVVVSKLHDSTHFGKISYMDTQMLRVSCFFVDTDKGINFPIWFGMEQTESVSKRGWNKLSTVPCGGTVFPDVTRGDSERAPWEFTDNLGKDLDFHRMNTRDLDFQGTQLGTGRRSSVDQCFFNFKVAPNHLRVLIKCRFWFSQSGMRPKTLDFRQVLAHAWWCCC